MNYVFFFAVCIYVNIDATKDLQKKHDMILKSSAFKNKEYIPLQYTCDGKDMSPPLYWSDAPIKTKSFILFCVDQDAPSGEWVHWIVYDIPVHITSFAEGVDIQKYGAKNGETSWGEQKKEYHGPCPPSGEHRYFFTLYALDIEKIDIVSKPTKNAILDAIKTHILAEAQIVGLYHRKD